MKAMQIGPAPYGYAAIRLRNLYIVHPKGGSFVYDSCTPKAGAVKTLASITVK